MKIYISSSVAKDIISQTTKPEEPFWEKTDHMLARNYGAYYISKSLDNAEIHFGETDLLHSLNKPKAVVELHIGANRSISLSSTTKTLNVIDLYPRRQACRPRTRCILPDKILIYRRHSAGFTSIDNIREQTAEAWEMFLP